MDDSARYNQQRWQRLVDAGAVFTRPYRDMTAEQARERLDPNGELGDLRGKRVLGLAGGGGQQSVLYGLLGAQTTILDLSDAQLDLDREMAAAYGFDVTLVQGDIRDLSIFEDDSFDIIDHAYSLNFVPDLGDLFEQVARVIAPGGIYTLMFANPFSAGVRMTAWNGSGYTVSQPYQESQRITYADEDWVYDQDAHEVPPPVEYRHTLSTVINGLARAGFVIRQLYEVGSMSPDAAAEGGTWDHLTAVLPPWLWLRAIYRPGALIG